MRSLYIELRVNLGFGEVQRDTTPPAIGVIKEWKFIEINSYVPSPSSLERSIIGPGAPLLNESILVHSKYVGRYEGKDADQELAVKTACELQSKGFFDFTIQINEYMSVEELQQIPFRPSKIVQEAKLKENEMMDYIRLMFKSMGIDDSELRRKYEIEEG